MGGGVKRPVRPSGRPAEYAALTLAFVCTRVALYVAGLRFNFSLDWMWLSDPADLRNRFLETIYYFHAFPPGMDVITGILLKIGGTHAAALAFGGFTLLGLVLAGALFYLGRALGLSFRAALVLALAFSLIPQTIYFEFLYLYEEPVTALLVLSVAIFHAAVRRPSFRLWFAFFLVCAAIGIIRSTFHLVWFVGMVGVSVWATAPAARRRVLLAAAAPAALLLALYIKNLVVFGTFGALTYGPSSYAHVTVSRLPPAVRAEWIAEHRISPYAALSPYAGPRDYARFFPADARTNWPSQLTDLDRPSVHAPNFNHWFILEANRGREADAWYYLKTRPSEYLANALLGLRDLFTASTEWHPYTGSARSPHYQHRQVLGAWEHAYNRIVHGFPIAPVGLYVFLPLVLVWAVVQAWRLKRSGSFNEQAQWVTLLLCVFQIVFAVGISSAFTFLESSRYRFQVEPLIWLLTALCLTSLLRPVLRRV